MVQRLHQHTEGKEDTAIEVEAIEVDAEHKVEATDIAHEAGQRTEHNHRPQAVQLHTNAKNTSPTP